MPHEIDVLKSMRNLYRDEIAAFEHNLMQTRLLYNLIEDEINRLTKKSECQVDNCALLDSDDGVHCKEWDYEKQTCKVARQAV